MLHTRQDPQLVGAKPCPVAVFDYDGTCIDGQSGKLISTWLLRKGYLSMRTIALLAWWGTRYKLHLPHRQEQARELIFRDLGERPPSEVERIMAEFHDEVLKPLYRPQAVAEVARRHEEGCAIVLVSATFDVIARVASAYLGVDGYVATQMERDANGGYTGKVQGDVIAGDTKVRVARDWADEQVGVGAWHLAYAYGDHHTDAQLLAAAEHPYAVSPGPSLKKQAKRQGWPILEWEVQR